jgi:hypothetical protein
LLRGSASADQACTFQYLQMLGEVRCCRWLPKGRSGPVPLGR